MVEIKRGQLPFFLIPLITIVILLPVAIWIGLNTGEDNEPVPEQAAAETAAAGQVGDMDEGTVAMVNFAFMPQERTLRVGETLTFRSETATGHGVALSGGFGSQGENLSDVLRDGQSYEWEAEEAGEFNFYCYIHPNEMTFKATVTP
jgi:plastocyanin